MKVYAKNCFDRFGDDLTELILQYLTFEDKVRLECVSKQWRRLVFNKQFEIIITPFDKYKNSIKVFADRTQLNEQYLESVLKKCPNIKRVYLDLTVNTSVLSLIGRYCQRIKLLKYKYSRDDNALDFFRINGHKLEDLYLYKQYNPYRYEDSIEQNNKMIKSYLKYCPNLKIINYPIEVLIIADKEYLQKLESIKALEIRSNEVNKLKILSDKYSKTMKTLNIKLNDLTEEELKTCIKCIARFENLKELRLELGLSDITQPIDDCLSLIGQKCNKLLKFSYTSFIKESVQFVKVFSQFKAIKNLNISLPFNTVLKENIESLKHCKQLIKLDICNPELTEDFFTNIEIFVPKLRFLRIHTRKPFSDSFINYFHSMKFIQNIKLEVYNENKSELGHKFGYFDKSVSEVMLSPNGMNVKHITHNCGLIIDDVINDSYNYIYSDSDSE